eukprot:TRINITY_DN14930_c0_g1_i1.p1 TRINITY_DN14930_c0_g1~~TRINITY_DN14930_c0_g1_i1.p1  ORF type:complete len:1551 (-),score=396.30 TRINITY_DN14930_c0_g1_i1:68-4687(-)
MIHTVDKVVDVPVVRQVEVPQVHTIEKVAQVAAACFYIVFGSIADLPEDPLGACPDGSRFPDEMQKYVVGFAIADARNLQTEDGEPCDPFVLVECCGSKWQTSTKTGKMQHVPWNESNIWPSIMLHPEEFESAYIEFSVFARNWFSRNYLIGKASLQLTNVNKRSGHVYVKKSLFLRQQGSTVISGILNLTVFCLKPGQFAPSESQMSGAEATGGENKEEEDDEDVNKLVLGKLEAPQGRPYHVHISIYRVEKLAQMGYRFPNPFVTVEFCGASVKTAVATDVEQYTWNENARIPVQTPVYEDTILIKLWHHNFMAPDELLAQGLVSFSELRNNALPPRWFCLYGWDPDEVPDVKALSKGGEQIKPNFYRGRLLISGRVERIPDGEEMQAACSIPARPPVEPALTQVALFADVYEVSGAAGRECQVEISFEKAVKQTAQWVSPTRGGKTGDSPSGDADEEEAQVDDESVTTFRFSQAQGRIDPLLVMTPEELDSQPWVMINVYTRGVLSGRVRVGHCMRRLHDFPKYELGNPAKPRFFALEGMPQNASSRTPPSVLMAIERYNTDDVPRHNRKNVKPMSYVLRAYVFMGRNIRTQQALQSYAVRVACAGVSKSTPERTEVRPMWMQALDLKVTLSSDHPKEPPTMEPIIVTLVDQSTSLTGKSQIDIGKTVCTYEYMRKKDSMGNWEPYRLQPQWITIMGGDYGGKPVGDILIAFELLQWKFRDDPELLPKAMWPAPDLEFNPAKNFSRLRKATLYFSLYGLRDVIPAGLTEGQEPEVIVRVKKFIADAHTSENQEDKYYTMRFEYKDLIPGGEKESKWDRLHKWRSDALGKTGCWNYELFQVQKLQITVPDNVILQPFITVILNEKPWALMSSLFKQEGTFIGEHRQSLVEHLPCCWYPGIDENRPYCEQKNEIEKQINLTRKKLSSQEKFVEESSDERLAAMRRAQEQRKLEKEKSLAKRVEADEERDEAVNSAALPAEMRPFHDKTNPVGFHDRESLMLTSQCKLNMHVRQSFAKRIGEKIPKKAEDMSRAFVSGKLEDCTDKDRFCQDFVFKNRALLKTHDIVDSEDSTDWNFRVGECFGFVKYAFKLVHGWEDDEVNRGSQPRWQASATPDAEAEESDVSKLRRSYGLPDEINQTIFDESSFIKMYKGKENVPSRVRVRIYFVQAIVIFGKGHSFGDPYLSFRLGKDINVSMRNMVQFDTNTPTFYRVEERDVDMPTEARLKIDMTDYAEIALQEESIGTTIIDLEDRWHSPAWRRADDQGRVPKENRPLYTYGGDFGGKHNNGSIELWVEMLDSVKASDRKATELRPPPAIEVEVRVIIWTTTNVKIVDGNHTDVKIGVDLDCQEYMGESSGYPKTQFTDVHMGSKDGNAEFNWRIVFPHIVMPTKGCTLEFKVYDNNLLSGDIFIGSVQIDLRRYVEKVAKEMDMISRPADLLIRTGTSSAEDGGEEENIGQIQFELQVMTQSEAAQKAAGKGREEPNEFPQLVTPTEGRGWGDVFAGLSFTMPDLGLMKKAIPLIIFTLACLVGLRFVGLL